MNNKEKKIQIALGTYLDTVWNERKKLRAKGDRLYNKGRKLIAKGYELIDNGQKQYIYGHNPCETLNAGYDAHIKGNQLYNEKDSLYIKSDKLFRDAVTEVYNENMTIHWYSNDKCTLSNGQEFYD